MKPTSSGETMKDPKLVTIGSGDDDKMKPTLSIISLERAKLSDASITSIDMSPVESEPDVSFPTTERDETRTDLWTGHYVCSVLTAICCFSPLSFIGLAHFMSAQTEHRLGFTTIARSKKRQAKVWTTMAWVFGMFIIAALLYNYFGLTLVRAELDSHRKLVSKPENLKVHNAIHLVKQQEKTKKEARTTDDLTPHDKQVSQNSQYVAQLQYEMRRANRNKAPALRDEHTTTKPRYIAELQFEMNKRVPSRHQSTNSRWVDDRTPHTSIHNTNLGYDWGYIIPTHVIH